MNLKHVVLAVTFITVAHSNPAPTLKLLHKAKKVLKDLPVPTLGLGLGKGLGLNLEKGGVGGLFEKEEGCVEEHVKEIQVVHEKPVFNTVVKEVPVTVIREEPFERIVHVDRPFEVIKEVPIERIIHVDRPVEVIKEVPFEVVSFF